MDCILVVDGEDLRTGGAALALRHIETAIEARGRVERRDVAAAIGLRGRSRGFEKVRTSQTIVAFGRSAHIGLADFEKRSVFSRPLSLENSVFDPEQVVWSCVNTVRALALGDAAWRSMQVLPIEAICTWAMPPLAFRNSDRRGPTFRLRVIDHEREAPRARTAVPRLREAGFDVVEADGWLDDAAIHVHVGRYAHDEDVPRPIDSMASGRLVIQVPSLSEGPRSANDFEVRQDENGIMCRSVCEVAAACEDVRDDPTFFDKLVKGGYETTAPLLKQWNDVADALLS